LAANYPGGRDLFITAMNLKAKQYGLNDSYFTNPSGLDGNTQVTTALDLAKISEEAMKKPIFAQIVGTKALTVKSVEGGFSHKLTNINRLVGEVEGVLGVKTGWTEEARENLVTYLERDGKKIMIVVLGSQDRFGETKELINWIFANYEWKEVPLLQG
jgi:D-alanyl-D-alanine carboxypeptidase